MLRKNELKYPNSANLFQFCRKILDHKYGKSRVLDQDVGHLLGFDPADCSHWKKGKKNVRNIDAIQKIAKQLEVEEQNILDIGLGRLSSSEAFLEYLGYISTEIDAKLIEQAKKKYYMKSHQEWSQVKEKEFIDFLKIPYTKINQIIKTIHTRTNFKEAPLYLPEIIVNYPEIQIIQTDSSPANSHEPVFVKPDGKKHIIYYYSQIEMRPHIRYLIAKAMSSFFLKEEECPLDLGKQFQTKVYEIHQNVFAMNLLAPTSLLEKELQEINEQQDIVSQLSEIFWVSRQFIKKRLKIYVEENLSRKTEMEEDLQIAHYTHNNEFNTNYAK